MKRCPNGGAATPLYHSSYTHLATDSLPLTARGPTSDPPWPGGDVNSGVPVGGAELGRGRREVVAHRPRRQVCPGGDLLDRRTASGELQHVGLAGGQWAVAGADRLGGQLRIHVPTAAVHGADDLGEHGGA